MEEGSWRGERWPWSSSQVHVQMGCPFVAFGTDVQQQEKELPEGRGMCRSLHVLKHQLRPPWAALGLTGRGHGMKDLELSIRTLATTAGLRKETWADLRVL